MAPAPDEPLRVGTLQVSALVDHVASVQRATLEKLVGPETAGSRRCTLPELQAILAAVGEFNSKAGGSASNVARALATGFGVNVQLVGTRGADEWGALYTSSMRRAGVDTDRMRVAHEGSTGRSAILTCDGERTMRTYMDPQVTTRASDLSASDFSGCAWVFLSAYCLYSEGLLQRAVDLAAEVGAKVVLDLASYEVVRTYHAQLLEVLAGGGVHFTICNEDEAAMLVKYSAEAAAAAAAAAPHDEALAAAAAGYPADSSLPAAVLRLLLRYCAGGVVTRGVLGCVAGMRRVASARSMRSTHSMRSARSGDWEGIGGKGGSDGGGKGAEGEGEREVLVAVPAVPGVGVVDTTGAGDHFTAGFMYALTQDLPLERCCEVACLAGASAVRVVGAELGAGDWKWFHARLHGDLAGDVVQESSAEEVAQELLGCYSLISRLGRGAVYFGSARLAHGSPYWERAIRLAERVALLLGSPVWTGGGPGMMRAASEGGLRAGVPVGGIRISREAGTNVLTMEDYLSAGSAFTCKYMPTRKVALTDAGARTYLEQRTGYLFLPGGLGTMDELFSILTLLQLGKLGSTLPVPLVIVNWDGFYDGLMTLLKAFDETGALHASEVRQVMVAETNDEVVEYLASFYDLPCPEREDLMTDDGDGVVPGGEEEEGAESSGSGAEGAGGGGGGGGAGGGIDGSPAEMAELAARLEQLARAEAAEAAAAAAAGGTATLPGSAAAGNGAGDGGTPHHGGLAGGKGPLAALAAEEGASGCGGGSGGSRGGDSGAGSRHRSRRGSVGGVVAAHAVSAEEVLHSLGGTPKKGQ
ncbi:hypothetical protein HYH03_005694 [Edaphochlamys debaryana]|uniref:Carbohydrate kinase PfkB domain-containing protein n=1 Tax=Edaphochlamys debaryana TaxID=47281 RepID=A0A836C0Q4_9CHLO|nr:hypothetical protein HYH03_005694 [Edaphochlamys debaryana]|eukprot:KAG2496091.1 hypothetical protein HYH03_005694 [Edaphochlamys debaryana]